MDTDRTVTLQASPRSVTELLAQVKVLKDEQNFTPARELLARARVQIPTSIEITQQLALCTYKDESLHPNQRFNEAIALLESIGLRDSDNRNAETLALGVRSTSGFGNTAEIWNTSMTRWPCIGPLTSAIRSRIWVMAGSTLPIFWIYWRCAPVSSPDARPPRLARLRS